MLLTISNARLNMGAQRLLSMSKARVGVGGEHAHTVRLSRLAMLVECEGSITIGMSPPGKTRYYPSLYATVDITNTSSVIVDEAKETMSREGVAFTARPQRHGRGAGRRLRFDVNVHGYERVSRLLDALLPYLRSKRRQAEIVLEFIRYRRNENLGLPYGDVEWNLVTEIRALNGRMPNRKALDKALAYLARPDSERMPRATEYYSQYVRMCECLRSRLTEAA